MATQRTPVRDQPSFLLDAAAEVFLAVGFEKTSIDETAIRAGSKLISDSTQRC